MLQGELWARRLATEVGIELETSLQLWSALVLQLEARLSAGQRIDLSALGTWELCLQPEYILETTKGELLMPPRLALLISRQDYSPAIALSTLADSLELATEVRTSVVSPWLEAIPRLCITLLEAGHEVHWQGLGVWTSAAQSLVFVVSDGFAELLNKPFSSFCPEPLSEGSGEGLHRTTGELDTVHVRENSISLCYDKASMPTPAEAEETEAKESDAIISTIEPSIPAQEPSALSLSDDTRVSTESAPSATKGSWRVWLVLTLLLSIVAFIAMRMLLNKTEQAPIPNTKPQIDSLPSVEKPREVQTALDTVALDTIVPTAQANRLAPEASRNTVAPVASTATAQEDKAESTAPKPEPRVVAALPTNANDAEAVVLSADESLALLAQRKYGHRAFWVYIYEENREYLPDPHNVPIGTRLQLPPASKYGIDPKNTKSLQQALVLSKTIQ